MFLKFSCDELERHVSLFQSAEVRVASSVGPDGESRVGRASVVGLGRKHRRAEQVLAEAGATFPESLRPCQEGPGLGQMSSIHNPPGEDGTFWKAIKGPVRCRFWLPCCAHPPELVLCWRVGTQDLLPHAGDPEWWVGAAGAGPLRGPRLPHAGEGQRDCSTGPSAPTSF